MFGEINYEVTASDNIPREEPPLPKLFENNEVLYLDTRRGPEGTCLVGTMMIMRGEVTRTPSVEVHSGRPEALLVRAILERLEHQTGPLVVALTTADLPKSLLQQHRRFHAPYYYWLVLTLHEMARRRGLDVRLVGPVRPPAALTRSLEDAEDVAHRQTASRRQRRA